MEVMYECAEAGRDEAKSRARVDERDMKNSIRAERTPDGAVLVGDDWKIFWHEYGTGIRAGDADAEYPDMRGSTGSEAEEIPWTYFNEDAGHFVTTYGVRPQPMIRPGLDEGREQFDRSKKRRGL